MQRLSLSINEVYLASRTNSIVRGVAAAEEVENEESRF
jgi:hypothetical protein